MAAIANYQADVEGEWEGKLDLIKRTVASGATRDELELFLYHAKRAGLDPLARQIYFVKRKGKGTIQVGIDGLRLIADRTGLYAGNDDAEFDSDAEGRPQRATVVVYKMVHGQRCPFSATARWEEYFPGEEQGFQWKKMPHVMLAKCAEAQALRKAFPMEMSGLYVHEEMEQASSDNQHHATRALALTPELSEPTLSQDGGRSAFGYTPERWPSPKMFGQPVTESQVKMVGVKSRERGIPNEDLPFVRTLVLNAYQVGDANSKGNASLFIDWLMNAENEAVEAALRASSTYEDDGLPKSLNFEEELDPYADGAA
jgi:phage recombination protein Bet